MVRENQTQLDKIESDVREIKRFVLGDMNDTANPGLKVRMDRMERMWTTVTWIGAAIFAAIIAAVTSLWTAGKD